MLFKNFKSSWTFQWKQIQNPWIIDWDMIIQSREGSVFFGEFFVELHSKQFCWTIVHCMSFPLAPMIYGAVGCILNESWDLQLQNETHPKLIGWFCAKLRMFEGKKSPIFAKRHQKWVIIYIFLVLIFEKIVWLTMGGSQIEGHYIWYQLKPFLQPLLKYYRWKITPKHKKVAVP